jgi:hypothetical protein
MANFLITRYFFGKFQEIFPLRENGAKVVGSKKKIAASLSLLLRFFITHSSECQWILILQFVHSDFTLFMYLLQDARPTSPPESQSRLWMESWAKS